MLVLRQGEFERWRMIFKLYIFILSQNSRTISWQFGVAGILDQERREQKETLRLCDGKGGMEDIIANSTIGCCSQPVTERPSNWS